MNYAVELIQPRLRRGLKLEPPDCNSAWPLCLLLITPPSHPKPLKITVDTPLPTPDKLTPQRRQYVEITT